MDSKAWEILDKEEKTAITLSINHKKSSWEAGEILKKAHYKYLEIEARARKFFVMFTEHYRKYDNKLIPESVEIAWDFKMFIELAIVKRMGYRDIIRKIGKESYLSNKESTKRLKVLKDYMDELRDSKNPDAVALYDLILEYDRWNNFRILPEQMQQPSAFKRRNKTRLLKHLKNIKSIEPFLIERLMKKFSAGKKYSLRVMYLPLVSDTFPDGYTVIRVKSTSKIIDYLSNGIKLYVFSKLEEAEEYAFLVEGYLNNKKDVKKGQKFWPKFRKLVEKAYNYEQLNNIIPRRKNLEYAFRDLDTVKIKKSKEL